MRAGLDLQRAHDTVQRVPIHPDLVSLIVNILCELTC